MISLLYDNSLVGGAVRGCYRIVCLHNLYMSLFRTHIMVDTARFAFTSILINEKPWLGYSHDWAIAREDSSRQGDQDSQRVHDGTPQYGFDVCLCVRGRCSHKTCVRVSLGRGPCQSDETDQSHANSQP